MSHVHRRGRLAAVALPAALVAGLVPGAIQPALAGSGPLVFHAIDAVQTWKVPAGVHKATFTVDGAPGGPSYDGVPRTKGARVVATIAVTPGETLQIRVGGAGGATRNFFNQDEAGGKGGWNGGGDGGQIDSGGELTFQAPGGGGASDVRRDPSGAFGLGTRIIVAGGGGGHSFYWYHTSEKVGGLGGNGGGAIGGGGMDGPGGGAVGCYSDGQGGVGGGTGYPNGSPGGGGNGGGKAAGGAGGGAGDASGITGANSAGSGGQKGKGGHGGDAYGCGGFEADAGGGGGGGWYGGGGGGGGTSTNGGGGGGGGSSHGPDGATITPGYSTGGQVSISYVIGNGVPRADARIRVGTSGPFEGDDFYSGTGFKQDVTGSAAPGTAITFGLSLQNDGTGPGRITLEAVGTKVPGYTVSYRKGTTDITAAVVGGTWRSASLAPGSAVLITIRISVSGAAATGSSVLRTITAGLTKGHDVDVVKVTGERS